MTTKTAVMTVLAIVCLTLVTFKVKGASIIDKEYELVAFAQVSSAIDRFGSPNTRSCGPYVERLDVAETSTITGGRAIIFIQYKPPNGPGPGQISALVQPGTFRLIVDNSKTVPTIAYGTGDPSKGEARFIFLLRMDAREAEQVRPCLN